MRDEKLNTTSLVWAPNAKVLSPNQFLLFTKFGLLF
jgi:hypothetical protein